MCAEVSPEEIKQAVSVLKKANLLNPNLNHLLVKLSQLMKEQDSEKIELMYQIIYIECKKYAKLNSPNAKEPLSSRGKPPARIAN